MTTMIAVTPLSQSIAAKAKGKGASIKEWTQGRRDQYMLNPFDITIETGFNARDVNSPAVQEHIDGLARSIMANGLQRALKVRMKKNKPVLVDGECRLRATIRAIEMYGAEIVAVPVILTDKSMTEAEATLSLVVENSGLDLTALEKSAVFKRLQNYGWEVPDIADRAGLTAVRVGQLIELASVPDTVKEMIRNNEIAATLAWSIAKDNDFDESATLRCIKEAVTKAKTAGSKKVTARYVGSRPSFKANITTILKSADVCEDEEEDGSGLVMITLTREKFAELQALTKLDFGLAAEAE